ncbi:SPOR domain-containing protein [Reinekea marina]|uniref:SPOR domain-containing protein n=1 Tax=Reinekea marina TaxID=1310421 RepID=A0ABV7WY02_9GAMM|nr:SPOR domain-containing protein [Reinekea marina]MDN3647510.1 SPOR domain-containing protein [Reinekea marina]
MFRVIRLAILLVSSFAYGYDPQVSMGANATALGFAAPGASIETANTFNKRTVLAAEIGVTDAPSSGEPREVIIGVNGRLLYSMGLSSQWYPALYARSRLAEQSIETGFGIGAQFQTTRAVGLFTETLWSMQHREVHHKLGLRIWLSRFSSLDSRVKRSQPVGAVYSGGVRESKAETMTLTSPVEEALKSDTDDVESSATAIEPLALNGIEESQWFAHLGLFSKIDSLVGLEQDLRLQPYKDQFVRWYDSNRSAYRLLLGPYSEQRAATVVDQLQQLKLDSFVYQKPNEPSRP